MTVKKIFISWSKEPSGKIAKLLKELLLKNFPSPNVEFFISNSPDTGIEAGQKFRNIIDQNLEKSDFGILVLTKNNFSAPWMMFEAGALSKEVEASKLIPVLFDREPDNIESPIKPFQFIEFNKESFLELLFSIEKTLFPYSDNQPIRDDVISRFSDTLDKYWDKFDLDVKGIIKTMKVDSISENITDFMMDENAYDIVLSKRDTHLQELINNLEKDQSKRIIIVGGISTTLRKETTVRALAVWLVKNPESKLFICHENSEVASLRAQDLRKGAFKKEVDKKIELQKRKVKEFNKMKLELLQTAGQKSHKNIHFIEVKKTLTVYITIQGLTMFLTPVLDKRSSDTFTFKLKEKSLILDVIDYISSRIEKNQNLSEEIEKIKKEECSRPTNENELFVDINRN